MVSPAPIDERSFNFVQELNKDDVLLGRGTGPNEFQGNIRFRALVKETLQSDEFKKSTGSTKTMLARMIVRDVKAQNGRFLKKVGKSSTGRDLFAVVPDRAAVDKTRQSFRHQLKSIENRKPKTPVGRGDQTYCLLDSASGSSEKLSSAKTNSIVPLPKAKGFSATKEAETKRIPALASSTACSGGIVCSYLLQKARITGLVDPGSPPVPPQEHRSDAWWGGGALPSFVSSSAGPTLNPLFEASIAHRVACLNQQRLPRLPFPSSLGNQGRLERRMPVSSPNSVLNRLRFECGTPEQAARDLAYSQVLLLSRAMTGHY
jgi:hypothetical protein